jgi:EEF1A N-terminal glycine/lysine methyltransferase
VSHRLVSCGRRAQQCYPSYSRGWSFPQRLCPIACCLSPQEFTAGIDAADPIILANKSARKSARGPWATEETDGETEGESAISESDFDVASTVGHGPGESTLFLPGCFLVTLCSKWVVCIAPLRDAHKMILALVSSSRVRSLSWACFSKDVQSHTLQISKILAHPAPRAGDLIKLDASAKNEAGDTSLEVIARFPGGLDFGRGLVDINFTMWPLFKCLSIDNILTICKVR